MKPTPARAHPTHQRFSLVLLLALGTTMTPAARAALPDCPAATAVEQQHLLGSWRLRWDGQQRSTEVWFEPNPELSGSVLGRLRQPKSSPAAETLLAGDVDQGELALDESQDGQKISANWVGMVVEGSCGRKITGQHTHHATGVVTGFTLEKTSR